MHQSKEYKVKSFTTDYSEKSFTTDYTDEHRLFFYFKRILILFSSV